MSNIQQFIARSVGAIATVALTLITTSALAVQPTVKTVPWVPSNALIPHDVISGQATTLKGTTDVQGANFEYTWDFGDGSPVVTGTVANQYVVEASHTYTGTVGTVTTATLSVRDTSTNETDSANYFVVIQADSLETDVNIAIDQGLWYLHKTMRRFDTSGLPVGDWRSGASCGATCASSGNLANTPSNLSAFLVNGHSEGGAASNPYTETVQRALKGTLGLLNLPPVVSQTNPLGTFNPDADGNGLGVGVAQGNPFYQGGFFMDAIVATATPNALVPALPPFAGRTDGTGPGGAWTYFDVVQNMADYYAYCQYDSGVATTQPPGTADSAARHGGGWRYSCNAFPDGSAVQWAAIGLIAAERNFGAVIDPDVKEWMRTWTDFAHNIATGISGYTSTGTVWGPFATTPSGTVQMVWNGYGRGTPMWDTSENYLRTNFCNAGSAGSSMRDYYYGLFSFTKSMLLHDTNADGVSEPIADLECRGPAPCGLPPLDWYEAEASAGAQCDGVARTLVTDQRADGAWFGHNFTSTQFSFETSWAIIMLNRTVFASGVPVAVAAATPNPAVAGQTINLDGSTSFHQDPSLNIVSWNWDLDNDGAFDDASGPVATTSFPAVGNYPVGLEVCDDDSPSSCDDVVVTVIVSTPPLAPTADANGPYLFCPQTQPWFLDGTGSVNPDEGGSEIGQPGDTIQQYAWDLDGDSAFDNAFGPLPDITAFFTALGTGDYLIQLEVTDTTATSYPSSGFGDFSDTDSAQVFVKDASDAACACIDDLTSRPKSGKIQLVWTDTGASSYNVYRGTTNGGPYSLIANTTSTYSTYLDTSVTNGVTYYYVLREVALNTDELCQSNETSATPTARLRR